MTEFFDKIDTILKEELDHPVKTIIREDLKDKLKALKSESTPKDYMGFAKYFLISKGYKFITDDMGKYDLLMEHSGKQTKFKIEIDTNVQTSEKILIHHPYELTWNCDYVLFVFPYKSNGEIAIAKFNKLKEYISKPNIVESYGDDGNCLFPYELFKKHFRIIDLSEI